MDERVRDGDGIYTINPRALQVTICVSYAIRWKYVRFLAKHTFHRCVCHTDKATSVGALVGVLIERKVKVSTATVGFIRRTVCARVEVGAKVVVVASQQRAQCAVWCPFDT